MTPVLEGIRVVDLTGESGALAARVLADLGATVTRPEPLDGGHFSRQPHRHAAWTARTDVRRMAVDDPALDALLAEADVVLATRGHGVDTDRAPQAVWVHLSPFGLTGPRAGWRAGDLGILASTGNLFATGDPDRPPVRCAEPVAFAHAGPEAAFAALTGLVTGRPQQIDVSIQEAVMVASMGGAGRFARDPDRGRRRGRQHRPHPGDLALCRRLGQLRPPRRQGPHPQPRDAERPGRPPGAHRAGLDDLQPEHDLRRGPGRHRGRRRRLVRDQDHGRALRPGLRDQPDAGPDQLTPGAAGLRAAGGPRAVRPDGRRRRRPPRLRARPRRPGADRPAAGAGPVHHPPDLRRFGRGLDRDADPRVRGRGGGADRHPVLRRARRGRDPDREPQPSRLPPGLRRGRPRRPGPPRALAPVRRPEPRQAQHRHRPQAPRGAGPGHRAGEGGRRRGRELRPPGHARPRPRLRRPGRAQAGPGHDLGLPERPDRPPPGLPRLRRPGRGPRRIQPPDRLARP